MNCQPINDILRYHKLDCYVLYAATTSKKKVLKKILSVCYTTTPESLLKVPIHTFYLFV